MYKILLSHPLYKDGMAALENKAELIITNNGKAEEILEQLRLADAFILRIGNIDRKIIEQCPNLKVIARPGVGFDNVDVEAATEYGIPVVICPPVNARAVAEHTVSMMFAIAKNLVESAYEARKGNYNIRNKYVAIDILGKTISILGFGNIGKEVAKICSSIGMKVIVFDPYVSRNVIEQKGYTFSDNMNEAIAAGDFVSLHMPSTPSTRNLFSREQFAVMKPTAFLLNAARGDIIDEIAMLDALKHNKIAGVAADVLVDDPPSSNNPFLKLPNFIYTPHMAAQTQETASKIALMAVSGTLATLQGEKWEHVANKEVYEHPRWRKILGHERNGINERV